MQNLVQVVSDGLVALCYPCGEPWCRSPAKDSTGSFRHRKGQGMMVQRNDIAQFVKHGMVGSRAHGISTMA